MLVPRTVLVRFIPTGVRTVGSAFTKISKPFVGSEPWMLTAIWIRVPFNTEIATGETGQAVEKGSDMQTVPMFWPWAGNRKPGPAKVKSPSVSKNDAYRFRVMLRNCILLQEGYSLGRLR